MVNSNFSFMKNEVDTQLHSLDDRQYDPHFFSSSTSHACHEHNKKT